MSIYATETKTDTEALRINNIVKAANSYPLPGRTIQNLANGLKVSTNVLTQWFLEAISKRYIQCDTLCVMIMNKHIAEYQKYHMTNASSLKELYHEALEKRFETDAYMGLIPLDLSEHTV